MKIVVADTNGFSLTFETSVQFDERVGSQTALDELETAFRVVFGAGMETHLALMALLANCARRRSDVADAGAAAIHFQLTEILGSVLQQLEG